MDNPQQNEYVKLKIETFKERLKKREIWLNGDIDSALIETLYANLIKLENEGPGQPLTVTINSDGGNFYESIVATDIMGTISSPVKTIALANANSGGFIIFMGGGERICHDYTCLMMHSVKSSYFATPAQAKDKTEYMNYTQEKVARFFSFQTDGKTSPKYWMELFDSGKDKWFSIEEALKLGIIHRVIKRPSMVDPAFTSKEPFLWNVVDLLKFQQE